jgi:hypothetical protein
MSYLVANNDREMLNFLMEAFDNEHWECEDCGNTEDCATMDSAIALRNYLSNNTDTITLLKNIKLHRYVNAANISADDMPHTVVEKLQSAIDEAIAKDSHNGRNIPG